MKLIFLHNVTSGSELSIAWFTPDTYCVDFFKPPPPTGAGGGYMFSGRPCVRPCIRDSRGSFMFPRYLQYLLTDFRQTLVTGASWDTDDLIAFLGQKVKVQGHTIAAEEHSTQHYRRVQLFLVIMLLKVELFLL